MEHRCVDVCRHDGGALVSDSHSVPAASNFGVMTFHPKNLFFSTLWLITLFFFPSIQQRALSVVFSVVVIQVNGRRRLRV